MLFSEPFGGRLYHPQQHLLGQHTSDSIIRIFSTSRLVRTSIRKSLDNRFSKIPNQDKTGGAAADA
jgi:hypothetical protein